MATPELFIFMAIYELCVILTAKKGMKCAEGARKNGLLAEFQLKIVFRECVFSSYGVFSFFVIV